ncbi:TetR/AcrR family transcriptional regulator [Acidocella sp.]|uniref:TetR/AcrR family transcriptional regulator n=1 Tax=Acidocella sp. TaxID=50710 RepID=UPI0017EEE293|nr:TetR/AcrR family transcriptional regulator [Acidocella sp.]NNM56686.1 TetR family transcriptional regulator [Acidocella sp.]
MQPSGEAEILAPDLQSQSGRSRDPERTKQDILDVATEEFAAKGYAGGRVDAIAARTQTTKRMIYYYFGSKELLYSCVLARAYRRIRQIEEYLDLDRLDPETALRRLVEFTFDYHDAHPDFVRLVMIENIHNAEYVKSSEEVRQANRPAIVILKNLLERGRREGVFKREIEPVDLHLMISALCYYRVSNRHTFGTIFDCDLTDPRVRERQRRMVTDTIASFLLTTD